MLTLPQLHQPDALSARLEHLRRRALRQHTTLKVVSAAIAHAPTLDECAASVERARQQLEHLECSVERFRELSGGDLMDELSTALVEQPRPESWLEATVAQLVLCVASWHESREPLARVARIDDALARELAEEAEYVDAARAALRELCRATPTGRMVVSKLVSRWLLVALETLERSARRDYLAALRREIERLGLVVDAAILAA